MALGVLGQIADEIQDRFGVERLAIVHRTGEVPLGEASVAIVAVAPHRDAAFEAARYAIDETKARAPIWKAERFRDGHVWIGEPARTPARRIGPVKVYISVDMEGVGGISHPHPTDPKDARYPASVDLMVGEANAAIEGALAGGATEVLVNDSHSSMYNLLPEAIDPRATVLQGQKAWSMVAGARTASTSRCSSAITRGPGTRAGRSPTRTRAGRWRRGSTAGRPANTGSTRWSSGGVGIPVGLVTGDDALAEEVADWLPWAERVVVKRADGGSSAASVHPSRARDLVRGGAERAVGGGRRRVAVPHGPAARRHRGRLPTRRHRRPRRDPAGRRPDRRPHGSPRIRRRGVGLPGVPRCRSPRRRGRLRRRIVRSDGRASPFA